MEVANDPKNRQRVFAIVFFIAVVLYIAFILSRSLWQNYKINQDVGDLEEQVAVLEDENSRLKNLVVYLQTDAYKEKEARRKLLMKMPGEKVIALPSMVDNEEEEEEAIEKEEKKKSDQPNYQMWIRYIFS